MFLPFDVVQQSVSRKGFILLNNFTFDWALCEAKTNRNVTTFVLCGGAAVAKSEKRRKMKKSDIYFVLRDRKSHSCPSKATRSGKRKTSDKAKTNDKLN